MSGEGPIVVTIDGPAGAGKSSAARLLAQRLGFRFLDTGAMYRAMTLAALEQGATKRPEALERLAGEVAIQLDDGRVLLDGRDVTERIRRSDVTRAIHDVADHPAVRRRLAELQRREARRAQRGVVAEGRDQGTVVFPDAACKIFLTASPEQRARRRLEELRRRGEAVTLEQVLAEQAERDRRDASRPLGRLVPAEDAVLVDTDGLSLEQVVDRLEALVRRRLAGPSPGARGRPPEGER